MPHAWRRFDSIARKMLRYPPWYCLIYFFGAFYGERVEKIWPASKLAVSGLDFDADDAAARGRIRAKFAKIGRPIGPYDVMIAGQALARSLTLVTRGGALKL